MSKDAPTKTGGLAVTLASSADRGLEGRVTETFFESDGAVLHVAFPRSSPPGLAVGEITMLKVSGGYLAIPMTIPGRVTFQRRDEHCRFQFHVGLDEGTVINLAMNRREAVRVRPKHSAPIEVTIRGDDAEAECRPTVYDIATSGIGLLLPVAEEFSFASTWRLELSLILPGAYEPIVLSGDVRYRRLQGSAIRYGVEFDKRAKKNSPADIEKLRSYVMHRQLELLRTVKAQEDRAARRDTD